MSSRDRYIIPILVACLSVASVDSILARVAFAEDVAAESEEHGKPVNNTKLSTNTVPTSQPTRAGIFLGHITFIDLATKRLEVYPANKDERRTVFYFDKKTKFNKNSKLYRAKVLKVGDKVAVRFFGEPRTYVADEVFVVKGDYVLKDYQKKFAKPAAEGGGEHGAAKKPEAKPAAESPAPPKKKEGGGGHH